MKLLLRNRFIMFGAAIILINVIVVAVRFQDYKNLLESRKFVNVWVAKETLHRGTFLAEEYVKLEKIEVDKFNADFFKEEELSFNILTKESDFVIAKHIDTGEKITKQNIISRSDPNYISKILIPGYRAVTLPIRKERINNSSIIPGSRVDIQVAFQHGKEFSAKRILCSVKVLEITETTIIVELDNSGADIAVAGQKEGDLTFGTVPILEDKGQPDTTCGVLKKEGEEDSITIIRGIHGKDAS